MAEDLNKTRQIIALLEQTTSLAVVGEFLKLKKLTHSAGSWVEMRDKRILPRVENNEITNLDLIGLLRSAEESGGQHVFLYACPKARATELMERARIASILRTKGLARLLEEPDVLDQPEHAQIVDVRWERASVDINLVVKEIEPRTRRKFLRDEIKDGHFHRIYTHEQQRAVNVAKLHRDGLLELRIASHANSSKYDGDLLRFWRQITDFFPYREFKPQSLTTAKDKLWETRGELRELVRYTDATVCNVAGNLLRAVTGSERNDLSGDDAIGQSLDLLMDQDEDAYCADANLWFRKSAHLSTDVHVILNGEVNEFALPAHCSEEDYKYVLSQIRFFNR